MAPRATVAQVKLYQELVTDHIELIQHTDDYLKLTEPDQRIALAIMEAAKEQCANMSRADISAAITRIRGRINDARFEKRGREQQEANRNTRIERLRREQQERNAR